MQATDTFASWLERALRLTGMSKREASMKAGLGEAQVSSYTKAQPNMPSADAAVALAHLFQAPVTDVLWAAQVIKIRPQELADRVARLAAADERFQFILRAWPDLRDQDRDLLARLARLALEEDSKIPSAH